MTSFWTETDGGPHGFEATTGKPYYARRRLGRWESLLRYWLRRWQP